MKKKVIVCLKGGLGNQLFQYAAGRRLAYVNNAELVLDNVTYFKRDSKYKRKYQLDKFYIKARLASKYERMEFYGKYIHFLIKKLFRLLPYEKRFYIEEESLDFSPQLLNLRVKRVVYLDGYWQSEGYFKDIEHLIKQELKIIPPQDKFNQFLSQKIQSCNSVAIHIRFFIDIFNVHSNEEAELYMLYQFLKSFFEKAIVEIKKRTSNPYFFIFSDNPSLAYEWFRIREKNIVFISHNKGEENSYKDFWLMTQCKHFIISNSTFGWWAAWLAENRNKIIIAPNLKKMGVGAWGFKGLIPKEWILL